MGITDVFAKWLLDIAEEKLLKKKSFNTEERLRVLHAYLHSARALCKHHEDYAENFKEAMEQLPLEQGPGHDLSFAKYINDVNLFGFFVAPSERQRDRHLKEVNQHLSALFFLFAREGYESLPESIGLTITIALNSCRLFEEAIRDMKRRASRKDWERFRSAQDEFFKWSGCIPSCAVEADKLIAELLEFANVIK